MLIKLQTHLQSKIDLLFLYKHIHKHYVNNHVKFRSNRYSHLGMNLYKLTDIYIQKPNEFNTQSDSSTTYDF